MPGLRVDGLNPAQPFVLRPSERMSDPILLHFEGGNALSAFRARTLLQALQRINERIAEVSARHVHWVRCTLDYFHVVNVESTHSIVAFICLFKHFF